jgi:transcription antitermination factor NusA-like protein
VSGLKAINHKLLCPELLETFLEELFEQEIPEVFVDYYWLKNVVRIPGESESRFL